MRLAELGEDSGELTHRCRGAALRSGLLGCTTRMLHWAHQFHCGFQDGLAVFLAARSTARSTWGHGSSFLPVVGTKVITRRLAVSTPQARTIDGALVVGIGMTAQHIHVCTGPGVHPPRPNGWSRPSPPCANAVVLPENWLH
jgi:hypothetical protein